MLRTALISILLALLCNTYFAQAAIKKSVLESNEEKIAQYFHEALNEYRVAKKKEPLKWHTELPKAAKNHNAWMSKHNTLVHEEVEKKKMFFTGVQPRDRVEYIGVGTSGKTVGENCLYFQINADVTKPLSEEVAKELAQQVFETWKASPGHNKNMLFQFTTHGTAITLIDQRLWATDVFMKD